MGPRTACRGGPGTITADGSVRRPRSTARRLAAGDRQAYRRLAKRWHPDHGGGAAAAARMAEINSAYDVLRARAGSAEPPPPQDAVTRVAGIRAAAGAWLAEPLRRALGRESARRARGRGGRRACHAVSNVGEPAHAAGRHRPAAALAARRRPDAPGALAALRRDRRGHVPAAPADAPRRRAAREDDAGARVLVQRCARPPRPRSPAMSPAPAWRRSGPRL